MICGQISNQNSIITDISHHSVSSLHVYSNPCANNGHTVSFWDLTNSNYTKLIQSAISATCNTILLLFSNWKEIFSVEKYMMQGHLVWKQTASPILASSTNILVEILFGRKVEDLRKRKTEQISFSKEKNLQISWSWRVISWRDILSENRLPLCLPRSWQPQLVLLFRLPDFLSRLKDFLHFDFSSLFRNTILMFCATPPCFCSDNWKHL